MPLPEGATEIGGSVSKDSRIVRSPPVGAVEVSYPWRAVSAIMVAAWIVTLGVFWETTASIVAIWYRSGTFNHGFVIPPIVAYLVWERRREIANTRPAPNLWGLPLLVALGFGWLLGDVADVLAVKQIALVGILETLVWTALGSAVIRVLRFPLGFFWFAVPIGEFLVSPLQDFTAFFAVKGLELSGVPVILEGRVLSVPGGTWRVAEACSGVRYLIATLVIGCLYGSLAYRSWGRRVGFIAASVVVPILANGLRAYGIIMLGYLSDNKIARGVDHLIYGWVFFGVVTLLLLWLGSRWRETEADIEQGEARELRAAGADRARGRVWSAQAIALTAAGGLVVALAPRSAWILSNRGPAPMVALYATAPQVTAPWTALDNYTGDWVPHFVGPAGELRQSYTAGAAPVDLYVGYYTNERQGAELIAWGNDVVGDGKRWLRLSEGNKDVTVDGHSLRVRETSMRSAGGGTRLAWSWYWVAGQFTSDRYFAKLLVAKARIFGGPQDTAVVAVGATCDLDCTRAASTLQDFLRHTASLEATLRGFSRPSPVTK